GRFGPPHPWTTRCSRDAAPRPSRPRRPWRRAAQAASAAPRPAGRAEPRGRGRAREHTGRGGGPMIVALKIARGVYNAFAGSGRPWHAAVGITLGLIGAMVPLGLTEPLTWL